MVSWRLSHVALLGALAAASRSPDGGYDMRQHLVAEGRDDLRPPGAALDDGAAAKDNGVRQHDLTALCSSESDDSALARSAMQLLRMRHKVRTLDCVRLLQPTLLDRLPRKVRRSSEAFGNPESSIRWNNCHQRLGLTRSCHMPVPAAAATSRATGSTRSRLE